jgi:hypothetical protein
MKWSVTAVAMSRATRKRVGKARVEIVDTETNAMFKDLTDAYMVEQMYEHFWNDTNPDSGDVVKVVDVREVRR